MPKAGDTTIPAGGRARFVERFEAAWSTSDPAQLMPLLDPGVRLYQPLLPPAAGRPAAEATMTRFLAATPGIHADVRRWVPTPDGVLIEFDLVVPGRSELRWGIVDRFDLAGDAAVMRISYWDLRELGTGLLRRPDVFMRSWLAGGRARGAGVHGAGGIAAPTAGQNADCVIGEFIHESRHRTPLLRGCFRRTLRGAEPTRVYVASPLWRGLLRPGRAPDFDPALPPHKEPS